MNHVIKLKSKFSVEIRQLIRIKYSLQISSQGEAKPLSLELCIYCTFDNQTHCHCFHSLIPLYRAYLYSWSPRILDFTTLWPLLYCSWVHKISLHIGCLNKNKNLITSYKRYLTCPTDIHIQIKSSDVCRNRPMKSRKIKVKSYNMNVDIQKKWTALKSTVLTHSRQSYKKGN